VPVTSEPLRRERAGAGSGAVAPLRIAKNPRLFEQPFRIPRRVDHFGRPDPLLTLNGRAAIWRGVHGLGLVPGARVLVPEWHCGSELDVLLAFGLTPRFYRLRADLSADLEHVETLLGEGAAAVYLIHYFGVPQPVTAILALARAAGAFVIEDLALGLFSRDAAGGPLGTAGDMTVFSLVKTLALTDGGALTLREPAARARARAAAKPAAPSLRRSAANVTRLVRRRRALPAPLDEALLDTWDPAAAFDPEQGGTMASAVARAVVASIDAAAVSRARRTNFGGLAAATREVPGVAPLIGRLPPGAVPAFFPLLAERPAEVASALGGAGIEAVRFWRRPHPRSAEGASPWADRLRRHVIRLPLHEGIGPGEVAAIARVLASCAK
jgi:dTDP-4-amino-4,6-dideoxygalactose transaminase